MKRKKSKYPSEYNFVIQAKRKDSEEFEDTIYGANSILDSKHRISDLIKESTFAPTTEFRIVPAKNHPFYTVK